MVLFCITAALALVAKEKQVAIWEAVLSKEGQIQSLLTANQSLLAIQEGQPSFFNVTLNYEHDLIFGREKILHRAGSHCMVEYVSETNQYTGLFNGAQHGIARFSYGMEPSKNPVGSIAAVGLKFFRDNEQPSSNMFLMFQDFNPTWNHFANVSSNHFPPEEDDSEIFKNFNKASPYPNRVGLHGFAGSHNQSSVKFPFRILAVPNAKLSSLFGDFASDSAEYLKQFSAIPAHIMLFKVYAIDSPLDTKPKYIGQINSKSICIMSEFGDKHLWFKHDRFETDLTFMPWWKDLLPQEHYIKYNLSWFDAKEEVSVRYSSNKHALS
jgi:hypothetical protein